MLEEFALARPGDRPRTYIVKPSAGSQGAGLPRVWVLPFLPFTLLRDKQYRLDGAPKTQARNPRLAVSQSGGEGRHR